MRILVSVILVPVVMTGCIVVKDVSKTPSSTLSFRKSSVSRKLSLDSKHDVDTTFNIIKSKYGFRSPSEIRSVLPPSKTIGYVSKPSYFFEVMPGSRYVISDYIQVQHRGERIHPLVKFEVFKWKNNLTKVVLQVLHSDQADADAIVASMQIETSYILR